MSALDKILAPISMGHWLSDTTRNEARAELAALRQRAEDAEMVARVGLASGDPFQPHFQRNKSGLWKLWLKENNGDGSYSPIEFKPKLQADPATGLPILTDEARRALEGEA